jgi:hypothetical protein
MISVVMFIGFILRIVKTYRSTGRKREEEFGDNGRNLPF